MKAVIQRVSQATVRVDGKQIADIGPGLAVLLGVAEGDTDEQARALALKTVKLRIFEDEAGKMNRSVEDIDGQVLVVSQFTLLGDARKGNRPSFVKAARPEIAIPLYTLFCDTVREAGRPVQTGRFGAHMEVDLINNGPVTILLEI